MKFSVCTIASGRDAHLRNLVAGLAKQSMPPVELIISFMQPKPYTDLPECPFPIRQIPVFDSPMPLSTARNAAAAHAHGDTLVFLDVDCIPSPGLIEAYAAHVGKDHCLMGNTRYLAHESNALDARFDALWDTAEQHPARRFDKILGPGVFQIPETTEFWSLSFALYAETFWQIGGFDQTFKGYGGEDTDFAMNLKANDIDLYWVPAARAVHQWHPIQKPPLNNLEHIVRNANLFRAKHGQGCMEYWLDQFEAQGFIRQGDAEIELLRMPSADEREAAVQNGSVRFS